jgi:hypothetical protein
LYQIAHPNHCSPIVLEAQPVRKLWRGGFAPPFGEATRSYQNELCHEVNFGRKLATVLLAYDGGGQEVR